MCMCNIYFGAEGHTHELEDSNSFSIIYCYCTVTVLILLLYWYCTDTDTVLAPTDDTVSIGYGWGIEALFSFSKMLGFMRVSGVSAAFSLSLTFALETASFCPYFSLWFFCFTPSEGLSWVSDTVFIPFEALSYPFDTVSIGLIGVSIGHRSIFFTLNRLLH